MPWAPDYLTVPVLKDYLHITDAADDVFLGYWITTASTNVNDFCGRQFGKTDAPESREYETRWDRSSGRWYAEVDDLPAAASLVVTNESAAVVTDYKLFPRNAIQRGRPFERIELPAGGVVTMSAPNWGWATVPAAAPTGMLLQAARLAARRDSPFGVAGSPTDGGQVMLLAQLDPDFRTSLKPYRRDWWAA